jgi:hypothetical protein
MPGQMGYYDENYMRNLLAQQMNSANGSGTGSGTGSAMPSIYNGQVGQNNVQIYGSGGQLTPEQARQSLLNSEATQFQMRNGAMPVAQWQALNPGATPAQLSDYKRLNTAYGQNTSGTGGVGNSLANAAGFELNHVGNIFQGLVDEPGRLVFGFDPIGTKIGNAVTGSNYAPLVNQMGGATSQQIKDYELHNGLNSAGGAQGLHNAAAGTAGIIAAGTYANGGLTGGGQGGAVATTPYHGGYYGGQTGGAVTGGAGAGAAGAGADAALPEIVVTGTAAVLAAFRPAGIGGLAGAGVGGLGSIFSGSNGGAPTNYGSSGGLQPNANPAATMGNGIGTGSNAGDLAASGGIQGGAGSAGVGGMPAGTGSAANTGWSSWLRDNAGSLAGLAAGYFGSGGTKNQTATTTNEPPAYLRPYLQQAAQGATALFGAGGPQYFPGATLAPQSQASQDALSGIIARAQAGSPLVTGAQNFVQNGLQQPIASNLGGVTNPYASPVTAGTQATNPYASASNPYGGASNPYLDQTFDHALQKAQSGVESQYQRAGRNIGASAPVMGDIASNLATQIYAPAYETERNRQLQYQTQLNDIGSGAFENQQGRQLQAGLQGQNIGAQGFENAQQRGLSDVASQRGFMDSLLGYASPLAAQDYMNLSQLQNAGANQDLYAQQTIDDARARYDYGQNQPGQTVDDYIRRLTGLQGTNGVQTTSQPLYQNQWANALGTAMMFQQLQNGWK